MYSFTCLLYILECVWFTNRENSLEIWKYWRETKMSRLMRFFLVPNQWDVYTKWGEVIFRLGGGWSTVVHEISKIFPLLWVNIKCRFQMGTGLYVLYIFVYISKCSIYTAAFVLEIFKYKILDGKYWYSRNFLYSSNSNLISLLKVLQLLPLKTHTH